MGIRLPRYGFDSCTGYNRCSFNEGRWSATRNGSSKLLHLANWSCGRIGLCTCLLSSDYEGSNPSGTTKYWGCGATGLAQLTVNQKVESSSLSVPARKTYSNFCGY